MCFPSSEFYFSTAKKKKEKKGEEVEKKLGIHHLPYTNNTIN